MAPDEWDSVLLEYTQDLVVVIDEEGTFRYVNDAASRLLGDAPEALVGENAFERIHPDDRAAAADQFEAVIDEEGAASASVRHRYRAAEGSWVWLESRFSNCSESVLGGYVVSSRDVTEQVEVEREREAAREHLAAVTGTVSDVLWLFDGDWEELLFVNPAVEAVYGVSADSLRAEPTLFLEAVHPADREHVREAMDRLAAGESVDVEYRVTPDDGDDRWLWVQGEPIVDDGEVVRIAGFSRDVTDRKRRERQLAVMDNLLRHNLRNDMSVVLGNAELIARTADDPTAKRAEIIRRQGEQLVESAEKQRTIIDLLTGEPVPESIDLVNVVPEAVDLVRDRHPAARIDLDFPPGATVQSLAEIGLVVTELIENAVRHDPDDHPEITVVIREGATETELEVRDSCPSIPEEEFRVLTGDRPMTNVYHSTGLGLWLVHWVVDLSGGRIEFTHEADGGNVVTLSLPRADGADA